MSNGKSSILPLLFSGNVIGGSRSRGNVASADLEVMNEVAGRTIVTLSHENNGWRFIGEDGWSLRMLIGHPSQVNDQEIRLC